MENRYNHLEIESKWQNIWEEQRLYSVYEDKDKPKYYVLDMFPYPSGAGLHIGHPLGYVASDIFARYKTKKGYNVLHPMGFDSFGLPAEQYAIQTGAHPADTTSINIKNYVEQLNKLGLSYDWSKKIFTSDPTYYKWTQWIFIELFNSWYDNTEEKARHINELKEIFAKEGNKFVKAAVSDQNIKTITSFEWESMSEEDQYEFLLQYRLAFQSETTVNWCPELRTVLANEEVKGGVSERGGHPVIKKEMKQWCLRITAYADRLLHGLKILNWSDSLKETQKNWIGKSEGMELIFRIQKKDLEDIDDNTKVDKTDEKEFNIKVFTTRPDTIFGVTYIGLAAEHPILDSLNLSQEEKDFIEEFKNKSELDKNKDIDKISGIYIGINAIHPFTNEEIPIWITNYVLWGYGTGAIMAVPGHDLRDYNFAKEYNLPIIYTIDEASILEGAYELKKGKCINSDFLNGFQVDEAIEKAKEEIEKRGIGTRKINYRLRDAIFSRQRYWGEPIPIYYRKGIPYIMDQEKLPLELPEIESYKPTIDGKPPLANHKNWKTEDGYELELSTMPGWAGSSWYFFRYMDNFNKKVFVSKDKQEYWGNVDLYLGGAEHATGHLIYARFWTMFLYDRKFVSIEEPFKKLINQGMIQGVSKFVYRIKGKNTFVTYPLRKNYDTTKHHVDVSLVKNDILDLEKFRKWRPEYKYSEFVLENDKYICGSEIEKMSKSKYNTINPDDIIKEYGADTLRLYSMFIGPLEHSKPWNSEGIEGVYRFLGKLWKLFNNNSIENVPPQEGSLKSINKLIKKVEEDIEQFSFNTCVSAFMICVNELTTQNCNNKDVLKKLLLCISPFAPYIAEELWEKLGFETSIYKEPFPDYDLAYILEDKYEYPIGINGKTRLKLEFDIDAKQKEIEETLLENEIVQKWLEGSKPKKIIIVKNKIINIVV